MSKAIWLFWGILAVCPLAAQSLLLKHAAIEAIATDGQGGYVLVFPQQAEVRKYLGPGYDSCLVYGGRNLRTDGLIRPVDVAIPVSQRLYVLDADSRRLVLLNTDLKWSGEVPLPADETGLPMPVAAFATSPNGQFALLNPLTNRIAITDENGRLLREVGGPDYGLGRLLAPVSLCADSKGTLYVLDTADHSLVIYDPFGQTRNRLPLPADHYRRVRMLNDVVVAVASRRLLVIEPVSGRVRPLAIAPATGEWLDVARLGETLLILSTEGLWQEGSFPAD